MKKKVTKSYILNLPKTYNFFYQKPTKIFDIYITKEDLDNFVKSNNEQLSELKGKRENLWKKYHRAKTEDKKNEILDEINDIQPKIKELNKYDKYCKEIIKRAEGIQNNLNNFDKDIQKEKDNSRSM